MHQSPDPNPVQRRDEKNYTWLFLGISWAFIMAFLAFVFCRPPYYAVIPDRETCIMNIRNFQTGARSMTNMRPEIATPTTVVEKTTVYSFMGVSPSLCPDTKADNYTVQGRYGDPPGTVFMRCSNPDHVPDPTKSANW